MRKRRGIQLWWHRFCIVLYWISWIGGIFIAALIKVNAGETAAKVPEWMREPLKASVEWCQGIAWWFLPLCLIMAPLLAAKRTAKDRSRLDTAIKKLLDEFRKKAFPPGKFPDYRVTLFQHRGCLGGWAFIRAMFAAVFASEARGHWPWAGWLVPYERAGTFDLFSTTRFYAPKHAIDQAEGYAGFVFKNLGVQSIEALPDLSKDQSALGDYARRTNTSESFVRRTLRRKLRRNDTMPLAFWGYAIEVDSQPWGVVLIDCRVTTLPADLSATFSPFGMSISILLSRDKS